MDVFALRERVIDEYRRYVSGFVAVREADARRFIADYFQDGRLWPEPLVQLNPAFQPERSIDQLVQEDALHPRCATIFRRRDAPETSGSPIRLHRHQDEAMAAAATDKSSS